MSPDEANAYKTILAWLANKDWRWLHTAALWCNWDREGSHMILRWIVVQPQCRAETALELFWLAEPEYYDSMEEFQTKEEFELCNLIAERFRAKNYAWHREPTEYNLEFALKSPLSKWRDIDALWAKFEPLPEESDDEPPPTEVITAYEELGTLLSWK